MAGGFWPEFLTLAGVHLLAVASPGPDFAITLRQSLRFGSKTGVHTALGIGTGILLHVGYTLLGFGLIISRTEWVYDVLRYVAAAYLIYLGILSLRARPQTTAYTETALEPTPSWKAAFRTGFLTNAFNPKVTLFFLSLYAAVVSESTPITYQLIYGIYMALATMVWFSFISQVFGNSRIRKGFQRIQHWIERGIGLVLLALAVKLIVG